MSGIKAFVGARIFDGAEWHDDKVLLIREGRVAAVPTACLPTPK